MTTTARPFGFTASRPAVSVGPAVGNAVVIRGVITEQNRDGSYLIDTGSREAVLTADEFTVIKPATPIAAAALERIRPLHRRPEQSYYGDAGVCLCGASWPCATAIILEESGTP